MEHGGGGINITIIMTHIVALARALTSTQNKINSLSEDKLRMTKFGSRSYRLITNLVDYRDVSTQC